MADLNSKISILIDEELRTLGDKEFAKSRNRLISEKVVSYGVKTGRIRKIVREHWKKFPELKTEENCFKTARELMSMKILDDQMAGIFLLGLYSKTFEIRDISKLKRLITRYIDNWAACDAMSSEVIAKVLKNSPQEIKILYTWAKSENIWLRRVTIVTTIKMKNKIGNWEEIASKILLSFSKEKEPIVKKAVHWLEREIN